MSKRNRPRNREFYDAMLELRRSNATARYSKSKGKGGRSDQRRKAIQESLGE